MNRAASFLEALELRIAPATFVVTTHAAAGAGSLAEAIAAANATPDRDDITFNLPGSTTITLAADLPTIVAPVSILGGTQPGYSVATGPVVALVGPGTGTGLHVSGAASAGSTIDALAISGFSTGIASTHSILISNNVLGTNQHGVFIESGATLHGNKIGTDAAGTGANPNAIGVGIAVGGSGNTIGSLVAGEGNLISGNTIAGIQFSAAGVGNTIYGNFIGTNAAGDTALPNGDGSTLAGGIAEIAAGTASQAVQIGGAGAGRNLISGNNGPGISIASGSAHRLEHNLIGTSASGVLALGNSGDGVKLAGVSAAEVRHNTIAGNVGDGLDFEHSAEVIIDSNRFGTAPAGDFMIPNGGYGVRGLVTPDTEIGGNLFTLNGLDDILLIAASRAEVHDNRVGFFASGLPTPANAGAGIRILESIVPTIEDNVVGANNDGGIVLSGPQTISGTIAGNIVGRWTDGFPAPNAAGGIRVLDGAAGHEIAGNTIADHPGIEIANSNGNDVTGNILLGTIGVALTGTSTANVIGGEGLTDGNSFQTGSSLTAFTASSASNTFLGNLFATGTRPIALTVAAGNQNDTGDVDTGPNGLQNSPTMSMTDGVASSVVVGQLDAPAGTTLLIEFFEKSAGGGIVSRIGSVTTTAGVDGVARFVSPPFTATTVVATASNTTTGATSEISAPATRVPGMLISPASVLEGHAGTTTLQFTVSLTAASASAVTVAYSTVALTATAGQDFTAVADTLSFAPGITSRTIDITVVGDANAESSETFLLQLDAPSGAQLTTLAAVGTITNDDTTLAISADRKTATWTDLDGDTVTLKASKPILDAADFTLAGNGVGEQVQRLSFVADGAAASGVALAFKAARNSSLGGDGFVNVGFLDATGLDLGKVVLPGDLGRVVAGDGNGATPGLAGLAVNSLGQLGASTQAPGGTLVSTITGALPSLLVKGSVREAQFNVVSGKVGKATIGGDLIGGAGALSGSLSFAGGVDKLAIGGSLLAGEGDDSGAILLGAAAKSITVRGDLALAGTDGGGIKTSTTSTVSIGSISIGGAIRATNADAATAISVHGQLSALTAGAIRGFSATTPIKIEAIGKVADDQAGALAIGKVTVNGSVTNGWLRAGVSQAAAANPDAAIGGVIVKGDWLASSLAAGVGPGAGGHFGDASDALLAAAGGFQDKATVIARIAALTIGGSVAGTTAPGDHYGFVAQNIGRVKIGAIKLTPATGILDAIAIGATGDVTIREVA